MTRVGVAYVGARTERPAAVTGGAIVTPRLSRGMAIREGGMAALIAMRGRITARDETLH